MSRDVLDEGRVALHVAGEAEARSTWWQKPWMVVMVAPSNDAIASVRFWRRARTVSSSPLHRPTSELVLGVERRAREVRGERGSRRDRRAHMRARSSLVAAM